MFAAGVERSLLRTALVRVQAGAGGARALSTAMPAPSKAHAGTDAEYESRQAQWHTHAVTNQSVHIGDYNLWASDPCLREAVEREGGGWASKHLDEVGQVCGSKRTQELAHSANMNPPTLNTHDRYGNRVEAADFHPSYHELMASGIETETPSFAWRRPAAGAHVARGALAYMTYQAEGGTSCPLTMTYACVPTLRQEPQRLAEWVQKVTTPVYDPRNVPISEKEGVTIGMSMTEKQGGSDVRANTTLARPTDDEYVYELVGHKWFTSAPMCDAFLTLAQTQNGLTCFLVPRWLPDGSFNKGFRLQRLKNKLGDKSNASSEVEYHGAWGHRVGAEGRGVATIMDMVSHTRLDCTLGSAGLMRQAVTLAAHHAMHRSAFGHRLINQPLMQNVLADLCVEAEAATALALRLARSFEAPKENKEERAFGRLATAVGKYWVCKRAPSVVVEAMEAHGGNGYVEDWTMPRLYRQAPLNSIWEGSGNVIALDVLRAMGKEPESVAMVMGEIKAAQGMDNRLDNLMGDLDRHLRTQGDLQARGRILVELLAVGLQGSLLVRNGNPAVAAAFCASRLAGRTSHNYGTLPMGKDHVTKAQLQTIIERTLPKKAME